MSQIARVSHGEGSAPRRAVTGSRALGSPSRETPLEGRFEFRDQNWWRHRKTQGILAVQLQMKQSGTEAIAAQTSD